MYTNWGLLGLLTTLELGFTKSLKVKSLKNLRNHRGLHYMALWGFMVQLWGMNEEEASLV